MEKQKVNQKVLLHTDNHLFKCLLSIFAASILIFCMIGCSSGEWYYETSDLEQYGKYVGGAEDFMTDYINQFFPKELSENFKDVQYTYHSCEIDEYAFEAYLEFSIEDDALFHEHVQKATEGMVSRPFHFDGSFQEYVLYAEDRDFLYDHIQLGEERVYGKPIKTHYQIHYAKIAKILVNTEDHRIIYVALALHDGGGADTGILDTFFTRFGIDPKEYEMLVNS